MRRKGEITGWQIDRDYPHQVEIAVPPDGFGSAYDAMHRFCKETDHRTRGTGWKLQREIGFDALRWCFSSAEAAQAFQTRFGGQIVPPLTKNRAARCG